MAQPDSVRFERFMDLPAELRNMVCNFVLLDDSQSVLGDHNDRSSTFFLPLNTGLLNVD